MEAPLCSQSLLCPRPSNFLGAPNMGPYFLSRDLKYGPLLTVIEDFELGAHTRGPYNLRWT